MSKTNTTEIANLVTQVNALSQALRVFQVGAVAPAAANDNALRQFADCPAEERKAAHNAGKQAQARTKRSSRNYTAKYKAAYDAHCIGAGYGGKYAEAGRFRGR